MKHSWEYLTSPACVKARLLSLAVTTVSLASKVTQNQLMISANNLLSEIVKNIFLLLLSRMRYTLHGRLTWNFKYLREENKTITLSDKMVPERGGGEREGEGELVHCTQSTQ